MAEEKTRVQFDFAPDALERLDNMKNMTGAITRADVIRSALRMYEWFLDNVQPNDSLHVVRETGEVSSKVPASLLKR